MLKVLLDLVELESANIPRPVALAVLQRQTDRYDPQILGEALWILNQPPPAEAPKSPSSAVSLAGLRSGHILAEDIESPDGPVLLAAGRQVTEALLEKLQNYAALAGIKEPIYVQILPPEQP